MRSSRSSRNHRPPTIRISIPGGDSDEEQWSDAGEPPIGEEQRPRRVPAVPVSVQVQYNAVRHRANMIAREPPEPPRHAANQPQPLRRQPRVHTRTLSRRQSIYGLATHSARVERNAFEPRLTPRVYYESPPMVDVQETYEVARRRDTPRYGRSFAPIDIELESVPDRRDDEARRRKRRKEKKQQTEAEIKQLKRRNKQLRSDRNKLETSTQLSGQLANALASNVQSRRPAEMGYIVETLNNLSIGQQALAQELQHIRDKSAGPSSSHHQPRRTRRSHHGRSRPTTPAPSGQRRRRQGSPIPARTDVSSASFSSGSESSHSTFQLSDSPPRRVLTKHTRGMRGGNLSASSDQESYDERSRRRRYRSPSREKRRSSQYRHVDPGTAGPSTSRRQRSPRRGHERDRPRSRSASVVRFSYRDKGKGPARS
ncbi:hypothetical protein F5Y15DRAFT_101428 [Xylariaceae sp. FL0016]|nr:hypothetical protein F5Y15DRAFT_101428 [Xylariaceae sp. FL0016]